MVVPRASSSTTAAGDADHEIPWYRRWTRGDFFGDPEIRQVVETAEADIVPACPHRILRLSGVGTRSYAHSASLVARVSGTIIHRGRGESRPLPRGCRRRIKAWKKQPFWSAAAPSHRASTRAESHGSALPKPRTKDSHHDHALSAAVFDLALTATPESGPAQYLPGAFTHTPNS